MLKQMDQSGSGSVNYLEFEHALKKTGIRVPQPQLKKLFQVTAAEVPSAGHGVGGICYSAGKSLNIEDFVARVAQRSSAPEFAYLSADPSGQSALELERRRAMKKVLHATNRQSDPLKVFRDIDAQHQGYIKPNQLKEGLRAIGSCLTDREFNYVMEHVRTDPDGKVSLSEFDRMVHGEVTSFENQHIADRGRSLSANARYSRSYQSDDIQHKHIQPEYSKNNESSKSAKLDRMQWSKLQGVLREHSADILEAFKNGDRRYWYKNQIPASSSDAASVSASTVTGVTTAVTSISGTSAGTTTVRGDDSGYESASSRSTTGTSRQGGVQGGAGGGGSGRHHLRATPCGVHPAVGSKHSRIIGNPMELGHIPIGRLKQELEEVGVILGAEDARRLDELVRREMGITEVEAEVERGRDFSSGNRNGAGSGSGSGSGSHSQSNQNTPVSTPKKSNSTPSNTPGSAARRREDTTPSKAPKFVSLNQFCDIVGIPISVNPSTSEIGT
jgi:Ca2+-binding EF-hand superfamily protein